MDSPRARDGALMGALADGDDGALAAVHRRLAPAIRALGGRLAGSAAAEDVVQDTLERVWRHAGRFDGERGSLDAWVLRIARNVAIGHLRRTRRLQLVPDPTAERADPAAGPFEVLERAMTTASVRAAVTRLGADRRQAVEQVLAGRTLVQAAGRLGLPEGTLKSRVRAAYAELRGELAAAKAG